MTAKLLLVDDHKIIREGLRLLLESQPDMKVVGEAGDGQGAIRLARELSPDVVLMEISLPDMSGIEATRKIVAQAPAVKVLALSVHSGRQFVLDLLRAGGTGYVVKNCSFKELARAIRTVVGNEIYLSPQIIDIVVDDYLGSSRRARPLPSSILTDRECEVLRLIAEGRSMKQIALQIGKSVKTVEACRRQIMDKLNLHSVAQLTKYAVREGLTPLEP